MANTRPARVSVEKERLLLEEYLEIRKVASFIKPWVGLCFDLAIVTGQPEGDLAKMRWSDIYDDKLHVVQGKTSIRISLSNQIDDLALSLRDVISKLKEINSGSDFLLGGKKINLYRLRLGKPELELV